MFKILIVEDDKELSLLFQKVLEKSGYQVKSASDGAQALEVLDREYIDLIISHRLSTIKQTLSALVLLISPLRRIQFEKVRGYLTFHFLSHWVLSAIILKLNVFSRQTAFCKNYAQVFNHPSGLYYRRIHIRLWLVA